MRSSDEQTTNRREGKVVTAPRHPCKRIPTISPKDIVQPQDAQRADDSLSLMASSAKDVFTTSRRYSDTVQKDKDYPKYLGRIDSIIDKWNQKMVQFDDEHDRIKD